MILRRGEVSLLPFMKSILPRGRFRRGVSVLVGGTAAAQMVAVLGSPLLARLYSPSEFGLLAVFAGLLTLAGTLVGLRYHLAVPLAEKDQEALGLLRLASILVLSMSALFAVPIVCFSGTLAHALRTPLLQPYLWLLPVGAAFFGMYQVLIQWAIRRRRFGIIARTSATRAVLTMIVQMGGYSLGAFGLVTGQVAGQAAGFVGLMRGAFRDSRQIANPPICRDVITAGRRYSRFAFYGTSGALFNVAGVQLPAMLMSALFSPSVAGIYYLAQRVLTLPVTLFGAAIGQVFLSHAMEAHRQGRLSFLVSRIYSKLAMIALPPAFLLLLTAPFLFSTVFGAEWREAGELASWMAPWIYLVFVTDPLSSIFVVLEKQSHWAVFQGAMLTIRVGALIVGAWLWDYYVALALFALGSAFCWAGQLVSTGKRAGVPLFSGFVKPTVRALIAAFFLTSPVILTKLLPVNRNVILVPAIIASVSLISARQIIIFRGAE